jgi:ribonucleoside-triphosphate reductase
MAKGDLDDFFKLFDKYIRLSKKYLEFRYEIIARKRVKNFPFVMGQKIYMGSEKLNEEDEIRTALKNSTLSIGYCGLAECLKVLVGKHHGESKEAQELGLKIIGHLREMTDKFTKQTHMNWSAFSTPAESTAGKFLRSTRKKFGIIPGVTDKEWFTNSNHVPVEYKISAFDKIKIEAPYHALTNAGNISYIELDGDPLQNLDAFEKIIRAMHDADMGYFSINHPVDRCLNCGYTGVIYNECPRCHTKEKESHSTIMERCNC